MAASKGGAEQSGYATPKIDSRGVVFRRSKILLVRELRNGLWTLPGGFADVSETPSEAVTREFFEETGGFRVIQNSQLILTSWLNRARQNLKQAWFL